VAKDSFIRCEMFHNYLEYILKVEIQIERYPVAMIPTQPFGSTGHESTRVLFGAAALSHMKPARVEKTLELLERYGVNHIDVAASYGDAELNLASWLESHRPEVFLATKTGDRKADAARASLERSLERMRVDCVDLIQLHNLVDEEGWTTAMTAGGALEALVRARDEGLVRFIGVTGHGTYAPAMHLRSLDAFEFASVLCPLNHSMMSQPEYAADFEALATRCRSQGVALQTIKSIARRRWNGSEEPRYSWYEPIRDVAAIRRAAHWVLAHDSVFLNSSSDGGLLEPLLAAVSEEMEPPSDEAMLRDAKTFAIEPLFLRDVSDAI
jgi:aryl-alcohol dehydrogenase-like predicted oxidoreductase